MIRFQLVQNMLIKKQWRLNQEAMSLKRIMDTLGHERVRTDVFEKRGLLADTSRTPGYLTDEGIEIAIRVMLNKTDQTYGVRIISSKAEKT